VFFALAAAGVLRASEQPAMPAGKPFLRVFGAEDYAGSPINSHVIVHPNGMVYVANSLKVLEFDGETWRQIPQPVLAHTSVLVPGGDGRIWTNVRGKLSQLVPDETGTLQFRPRELPQLAGEPALAQLSGGLAAGDGVYVYSPKAILRVRRDGDATLWRAGTRFGSLFWMDGVLHVTQASLGLFRLSGGELVPVAAGGEWNARIFAAAPLGEGTSEQLLLTERGPFRWDRTSAPRPLTTETAALFGERVALHAVFLSDGRLAFGTSSSGLLVLNRDGRVELQLAKADGLPSDRVNELAEDAEGGLWLAQQSGMARVQVDSPFRSYSGIDGSVRDLVRHEGRLFVAHGEGISVLDGVTREFTALRGLPENTPGALTFLPDGGRLLVNASGVREIAPDNTLELRSSQSLYEVHASTIEPGGFIGLQRDVDGRGLWLLEADGVRLRTRGKVEGVREPERFGFDSGDGFFWGTDIEDRVWRADFRGGLKADAPVAHFKLGAPVAMEAEGRYLTLVFPFAGGVSASRAGRLFRYDTTVGGFVAETRIHGLPEGLEFNPPEADGDGSYWFRCGGPGDSGRVQLFGLGDSARVRLFHVVPDGAGEWRAQEFPAGPIGSLPINRLYAEPGTRFLWICSTLGLFSMDTAWRPYRAPSVLRTFIRRVETGDGRLLFGGDTEGLATRPMLREGERALRVEFTAPVHATDFRGRRQLHYRTRLDGLDKDWTPWSPEPFRTFTNLPAGELTFRVQARRLSGRVSEEARFAFTVPPAWWGTWWAIAGYVAVAGGAIGGVVTLRTRVLQRKNLRLERTIAARTRALWEQNQELLRLHKLELNERITAQLATEKAQLVALRYQLNPHFLFNSLASIRGEIPPNLEAARAGLDQLAEFCRLTMRDCTPNEHSSVGEEFAMLRVYLEIARARWPDYLHVEIVLDPAVENAPLPRILLLPLVENAVKYGRETSPEQLVVRLSAGATAAGLWLEVANTGRWVDDAATHGLPSHGIGLDNLRERLRLHYPDAHWFSRTASDGWVFVRLELMAMARVTLS
jgi:hypothetical protein